MPTTTVPRRRFLPILLTIICFASCGGDVDALQPDEIAGDFVDALPDAEISDLPLQAEGFLATDRPWRAALSMRRYIASVDSVSDADRVLAARAEGGWGAWQEARDLLEPVASLEIHDDGIGLYLLGRALDETGDADGAVGAYQRFLDLAGAAAVYEDERAAAELRLGLARLKTGDTDEAARTLDRVAVHAGGAAQWFDFLRADALAEVGEVQAVDRIVRDYNSGFLGLLAYRARITAALNAGDAAAARRIANEGRSWANTNTTQSEFSVRAAEAARAMGDERDARIALRHAISLGAGSIWAQAAADALLAEGEMTAQDHLSVARVRRAMGMHEEAVDGFERWLASNAGTSQVRQEVTLELANALFYAERYDEVEAVLQPVMNQLAARRLLARTNEHLGRVDESERGYLAIAREHAGSGTGAINLYLAADARHAHGDTERAEEIYRQVISQYPGRSEMGMAMMRMAGIAFDRGDYAEAQHYWDDYRRRYPNGPNALQATYWSARAREAAGNGTAAAELYRAVMSRERDSYYALLAAQRLDVPFWPMPMSASPTTDAAAAERVERWMNGLDLLREAGFPELASQEVDRIVGSAGSDRGTLYALAEALAARGYSQRAIRIGLRLGGASPSNLRLMRIMYPFPYRTLIVEEAQDRGVDPFVAAALIRQESMFEARITSHVGARGLMQIMPRTGRGLAEAAQIDGWDPELLYHPEINVHLGTRYVAQHWENYDSSLPAVFSAYNAGSHRVARWQHYSEYGNDELFTERIPFRETRDYVKILRRNRAIYQGLYGE